MDWFFSVRQWPIIVVATVAKVSGHTVSVSHSIANSSMLKQTQCY